MVMGLEVKATWRGKRKERVKSREEKRQETESKKDESKGQGFPSGFVVMKQRPPSTLALDLAGIQLNESRTNERSGNSRAIIYSCSQVVCDTSIKLRNFFVTNSEAPPRKIFCFCSCVDCGRTFKWRI